MSFDVWILECVFAEERMVPAPDDCVYGRLREASQASDDVRPGDGSPDYHHSLKHVDKRLGQKWTSKP